MEKVVLVTGGSSGIGKSICTVLSAKGYKVYGTTRNPEKIDEKIPFNLVKMDVTDWDSVKSCVEFILSREQKIDVLINNAGIGIISAVEDVSENEFFAVFRTNVLGPLYVMQNVLPHMRKQKQGLVINVASIAGHVALPYRGIYCASKAALQRLTESLRMELKPYHVHACILDPGDFKTSINENRLIAKNVINQTSPYTSETLRIEKTVINEVNHSLDPIYIGKTIHKIIQSKKVKPYYTCGKFVQRFALVAKRLLSVQIFEKIIERKYNLSN